MVRCIKNLLFLLPLALVNYLFAQNIDPQYNFKHLNVQNGLAQNIVYHFLQDSYGYMWLGTHNGITIFDGVKATSFIHDEQKSNSLASNFITRILEDSSHNVWIGDEKGIDLFNRSNNTFSHFGVDRDSGIKDNTFCVPISFVSPGEFWFIDTKTKSIRAFNVKTRTSHFVCKMDEVDGSVYIDSAKNIIHFWSFQSVGTMHLVFKSGTLIKRESFFTKNNLASANQPLQVIHTIQQNDTTTWLSTNEGLICLNAVTNTYKVYNSWKGKPVKELRYAALSHNNILWLGSGPSGVYTFDMDKHEFTGNFVNNRLDPYSICSNNIVSVYFDKSGNVWCGSYGNGASYANAENNFFTRHVINDKESVNNIVGLDLDENENCWCLVEDQNGFWVFDKTFTSSKFIIPSGEDGKQFNGSVYKMLIDDDKNIWCATSIGLHLYDRNWNKLTRVKYQPISEAHFGSYWVRDMIRLQDGSVLFSTFVGLYRIKKEHGKMQTSLFTKLNDIYDKSFTKLFQDESGNLYVKGDDSLFVLKPNTDYEQTTLLKSIAFPVDVYQYFSDATQNVVYIATNEGLYVFDKKSYSLQKQNFIEHIPFQSISSVLVKDDKLWLFGEKGLYYFDKKNKQGRTFTIEDGLPGNEFNVSVLKISSAGMCIAGSTNGVVSFYPGKFLKDLYPPRAQLDHIYINDTLFNSAASVNETKNIKLTYRENTFAFDFSSIAFQHNKECNYEYKLEGYDKDWIKSGSTHFTRYSKIPPGTYTFKLRVYDVNGVLSPFTKALQISISKAFWQTDLFIAASGALVLVLCWLGIKWYWSAKIRKQKIIFEKQQAVDQERTRIAMEMHDDLGSGLTAIRYLAGGLSIQSSTDIRDKADKIATSAKSLVDAMNDIIWTMKSDNNSVEEILAYLKKQAAEQLETAGINCSFDFPKNIPNIQLNSEQKRNLLLISKEAIHNCIKHSEANQVTVTAHVSNKSLELKIEDNGKGFKAEKNSHFGNGLKNMQRRALEINAQLYIFNHSGTTITVTLPFG